MIPGWKVRYEFGKFFASYLPQPLNMWMFQFAHHFPNIACMRGNHRWETCGAPLYIGELTSEICPTCRSQMHHFAPGFWESKLKHGAKCQDCGFECMFISEEEAEFQIHQHVKETGHEHVHTGKLKAG